MTPKISLAVLFAALVGASFPLATSAQESSPKTTPGSAPGAQSGEAEMMAKMMELAQPGEQHKLLAGFVGNWTYKAKFSMSPGTELADAGSGTAVRKALMGGRYFTMDVSGKMLMPGPDGKVQESEFKGMSLDGYDNVKQKFVSTWIDNMGTGILLSEGSYDAGTKSFTYDFEMEMMPGMKTKGREVVTVVDADHHRLEWYEEHGGEQVKTMEVTYVRQK